MAYTDELKKLTVGIGGKDGGSGILMKPLQNDERQGDRSASRHADPLDG